MTDLEPLVAACKARPDDDTPRLVLADWWDDHGGEEHAAFIRAQVEASRKPDPVRVRRRWSGKGVKLSQMFSPMVYGVTDPVPATLFLHNAAGTGVVWHRGCIEAVSAPCVGWLDIGQEVLRHNPVRAVHIQARSVVEPRVCPITWSSRHPGPTAGRGGWAIDATPFFLRADGDWIAERTLLTRIFFESIFPGIRFVVNQFDPLRVYPRMDALGIYGINGNPDPNPWPEPVGHPDRVIARPGQEVAA